jgi:hypothetical protein
VASFGRAFELALAAYLLVLALAACCNWHRRLLAYPAVVLYSGLRIALLVSSRGRIAMTPLVRQARRGASVDLRSLAKAVAERRQERREAELTLDVDVAGSWISAVAAQATGSASQRGAQLPPDRKLGALPIEDPFAE